MNDDSESDDDDESEDASGSVCFLTQILFPYVSQDSSGDSSVSFEDDEDEKPSKRPTKKVVRKVAKKVVKTSTTGSKKATPKKKDTSSATSSSKATPASRKKKIADDSDNESGDEDNDYANAQRVMRMVDRAPKEQLVADLLCRWWYVLPEWPPADFEYAKELEKSNLRIVSLDRWEEEPDHDKLGRKKCYSISQYKGLFRDANQKLWDLRPIDGKPCFSELVKKSDKQLIALLVDAIQKQLDILSTSNERNIETIIAELKNKLKTYQKRK